MTVDIGFPTLMIPIFFHCTAWLFMYNSAC